MKRIIQTIAVATVVVATSLLTGFTDLPEDHWAYQSVQSLVEEGTVSGMPDGSFHPDDPVTRAQFVKMLGYRLPEARNDYIVDLRRLHWAYDNLLHSPLRTAAMDQRKILPDKPMTREQAAVYIYDCYADGAKSYAPSVVLGDTEYPVEVGWAYEHGIMSGSDGIHLNLTETISRAEAADLVVKTRQRTAYASDFADNVSEEALERVFNSSALFDVPYDGDALLTNGQVARASYRLILDRVDALWYNDNADFEHQYANDLKAMEFVLGPGRISADFADAPAMPEDAFAMLSYGVANKIHAFAAYGKRESNFLDARPEDEALVPALTFAWKNGVRPYGGGTLKTGTPVTHRAAASFLMQCDLLWGLQTSVTVDGSEVFYNDEPMRYENLPVNAALYQSVPASVPNEVADLPFRSVDGEEIELITPPYVNYAFYNDLRDAFVKKMTEMVWRYVGRGVALKLTYYPQLVMNGSHGFTIRIKAEMPPEREKIFISKYDDGRIIYIQSPGVVWVEFYLNTLFLFGDDGENEPASVQID